MQVSVITTFVPGTDSLNLLTQQVSDQLGADVSIEVLQTDRIDPGDRLRDGILRAQKSILICLFCEPQGQVDFKFLLEPLQRGNVDSQIQGFPTEIAVWVVTAHLARSLRLVSHGKNVSHEIIHRLRQSKSRHFILNARPASFQRDNTFLMALAKARNTLYYRIWDRDPFLPGQSQALHALQENADPLYRDGLDTILKKMNFSDLRILEVGSGWGDMTLLLSQYGNVTATELRPDFVKKLQIRFEKVLNVKIRQWDASQPWDPSPAGMDRQFDLIVAVNVLEHLRNDREIIKSWASLLSPGGRMILLVPHCRKLYGSLDQTFGHYRRYNRMDLETLIEDCRASTEHFQFLNPFGIVGWWIISRFLKRPVLPRSLVNVYGRLKGLLWPLEKHLQKWTGLSMVVVLRFDSGNYAAEWKKAD